MLHMFSRVQLQIKKNICHNIYLLPGKNIYFVVMNPYHYFFFLYKTNAWSPSLGNFKSQTCYNSLKYFATTNDNQYPTVFFLQGQLLNQLKLLK